MLAALPVWATTVIVGAHVLTLDGTGATARCVVIEGDRIAAVGASDEACARPGATRLDARGATLVPGFHDTHVHFGLAMVLQHAAKIPPLPRERWRDALRAAASRLPLGAWLIAQSAELPSGVEHGSDLDFIDHPVVVVTRHGALANGRAVRALALERWVDEGFVPGRLVAALLVELARRVPPEEKLRAARALLSDARKLGLTSIDFISDEMPTLFETLRDRGELTARVRFVPLGYRFGTYLYQSSWRGAAPLYVRVDGVKYYHDDGAQLPRRELLRIVTAALAERVRLVFHVLGRYSLDKLLDAIEEAIEHRGGSARLFRLDHVDELTPEDARRIARLGIPVCANPPLIAEWRSAHLGPLRTLLDAGAHLCLGSDWLGQAVVRPLAPLENLELATTHGGYGTTERISALEALAAYTRGPAYAEGLERVKGSIEPGKLADLVLLSGDPTRAGVAPHTLRVLLTMVGGHIVYRATEAAP